MSAGPILAGRIKLDAGKDEAFLTPGTPSRKVSCRQWGLCDCGD